MSSVPTPGLVEPHNSATLTAEVSGPADVSGQPGPGCHHSCNSAFFQRFFFSQGNVFVSRTPCSCVSVCPVSSDGGGGVVVCGGPSPTVTDRLSQVSRNCSQAPSVGIRSLLLPVWGGGDISRSRTDNRQHQAVTTNLTLQTTNTASTPAKLQILSINTTMLGIFTSTIFLIKARHVVKHTVTIGTRNISY